MPGAGLAPARCIKHIKRKKIATIVELLSVTQQGGFFTYRGPTVLCTAVHESDKCHYNSSRPRCGSHGHHEGRRWRDSEDWYRCKTQADHKSCWIHGTVCLMASATRQQRQRPTVKPREMWITPKNTFLLHWIKGCQIKLIRENNFFVRCL